MKEKFHSETKIFLFLSSIFSSTNFVSTARLANSFVALSRWTNSSFSSSIIFNKCGIDLKTTKSICFSTENSWNFTARFEFFREVSNEFCLATMFQEEILNRWFDPNFVEDNWRRIRCRGKDEDFHLKRSKTFVFRFAFFFSRCLTVVFRKNFHQIKNRCIQLSIRRFRQKRMLIEQMKTVLNSKSGACRV